MLFFRLRDFFEGATQKPLQNRTKREAGIWHSRCSTNFTMLERDAISDVTNDPFILLASAGKTIDESYVQVLQDAGYTVMTVPDANAAAVEKIRPAPDLIIARLQDERTDSLLLCRTLRSNPATRGVPIIVLTRWDDMQTREQILRAGATAISVEPLPRSLLLRQVRRVLARSASRKQLAAAHSASV
jgi:DNA-binding response OmpR family regulator